MRNAKNGKGERRGLVFGGLSSNPHGQGEKRCVSRRRVIQGEVQGVDDVTVLGVGVREQGGGREPLWIDGKKFPMDVLYGLRCQKRSTEVMQKK
jgi:hypothetical protein